MYFIKTYSVILFGFIVSLSTISAEIETDYFFGEAALRSSRNVTCKDDDTIVECALCPANKYFRLCFLDNCACLGHEAMEDVFLRKFKHVEPVEEQRAALRHHIAHFCPNLEVARECIRTCMQVGKPAFCGKDHQCNCGHKYDEHSEDKVIDIGDVYAKFRDLYQKYFGMESNNPIILNGK